MKKNLLFLAFLAACIVSSCKKDKLAEDENKIPTVGTPFEKLQDSIFLYAKESYLWNEELPTYAKFQPRKFKESNDILTLQTEVDALSQFAINPETKQPYEYYSPSPGESKYSFIDDGSTSGELGGQAGDFGFDVRYSIDDDLHIKSVYPGSPADDAGIKRGDKIVSINNRTSLSPNEANINFLWNALYNHDNINLGLERGDGTDFTANISVANYTINPVLTYKVITVGANKVGYMVFNSFTTLNNARPKINVAFNQFAANNVNSLIVDFRYNGGGYTETAEYLSNLIVPAAKNNTLMYTYYFNENIQKGKCPIFNRKVFDGELDAGDLSPENTGVPFEKEGALQVNKAVFIVTGGSASASELVINNLKPHIDVKLVGETSYGKPVGFFGTPFGKYELYIPQFETKNSAGQGGYYAGMRPGTTAYPGVYQYDDVTRDFGDENEWCLKQALNYINNGTFLPLMQKSKRTAALRSEEVIRDMGIKISKPGFKGMITRKYALKN